MLHGLQGLGAFQVWGVAITGAIVGLEVLDRFEIPNSAALRQRHHA